MPTLVHGMAGETEPGRRELPAARGPQTPVREARDAPESGSAVAGAVQESQQRATERGADAVAADLAREAPVADRAAAEQALLGGVGGELGAQRGARDGAVARAPAVRDRVGRAHQPVEAARVVAHDVRMAAGDVDEPARPQLEDLRRKLEP